MKSRHELIRFWIGNWQNNRHEIVAEGEECLECREDLWGWNSSVRSLRKKLCFKCSGWLVWGKATLELIINEWWCDSGLVKLKNYP